MGLVSDCMLLGRCVNLVVGLVSDGMLLSGCFCVTLVMGLDYVGFCGQVMTVGLVICVIPCIFEVINLAGKTSLIHYSICLLLLQDVPLRHRLIFRFSFAFVWYVSLGVMGFRGLVAYPPPPSPSPTLF